MRERRSCPSLGAQVTKNLILGFLQICIIVGAAVAVKLSFLGGHEPPYIPAAMALAAEMLKLGTSACAVVSCDRAPRPAPGSTAPFSWWAYVLPGFLYTIGNVLRLAAAAALTPAELALLWNLKIMWTALLFKYWLRRHVSSLQMAAIFGLLGGLAIVEYALQPSQESSVTQSFSYRTFAVVAVVAGTVAVSVANVWSEMVYKGNGGHMSVWAQNIYLYSFGIIFSAGLLALDMAVYNGHRTSVLEGLNPWCVPVLLFSAFSGIGTGFLLRYFSNIFIIYVDALALLANIMISIMFFSLQTSWVFAVGSGIIIMSTYAYHKCGAPEEEVATEASSQTVGGSNYGKGGDAARGAAGDTDQGVLVEMSTSDECDEDSALLRGTD